MSGKRSALEAIFRALSASALSVGNVARDAAEEAIIACRFHYDDH